MEEQDSLMDMVHGWRWLGRCHGSGAQGRGSWKLRRQTWSRIAGVGGIRTLCWESPMVVCYCGGGVVLTWRGEQVVNQRDSVNHRYTKHIQQKTAS